MTACCTVKAAKALRITGANAIVCNVALATHLLVAHGVPSACAASSTVSRAALGVGFTGRTFLLPTASSACAASSTVSRAALGLGFYGAHLLVAHGVERVRGVEHGQPRSVQVHAAAR